MIVAFLVGCFATTTTYLPPQLEPADRPMYDYEVLGPVSSSRCDADFKGFDDLEISALLMIPHDRMQGIQPGDVGLIAIDYEIRVVDHSYGRQGAWTQVCHDLYAVAVRVKHPPGP
jgi:hypothetical protein